MIGPTTYRLQWRRAMTRRYRSVAVALALTFVLAILAPLGISTQNTPVVTGHSSFYQGDAFDPCLGSIVGIMRLRVMWFNDHVLVERYSGDGAYIYASELGSPSPIAEGTKLVSSGVFYDFVDPNGARWHVDEAYFDEEFGVGPKEPQNPDVVKVRADGTVWVNGELRSKRWYTWIVAVGKPVYDAHRGNDPHSFYNFVTILNTCKFRKDNLNNSQMPDLEHEAYRNTPDNGHLKDDPTHTHETYSVALWVGGAPAILPVGAETPYSAAAQAGVDLKTERDPTQGDDFNGE